MQITVEALRQLVKEAVRARLEEAKLQEGPKEIGIRTVMMDMREPIVGSLTEDISRETGIEEAMVERVISSAYEKMIVDVVRSLDTEVSPANTGPRRRLVAVGG